MTSTPTKPRPDANANGRAGSAIVQSEGSPQKGDAGSSPARAADFSGCTCTVPPGELPQTCNDCREPTVRERLTARGLRLGDRVGTTKHDIVDGAGLVVFTGDAGQVAEWLDACTCSPCESGCDEACPTCCPPEPEQDEPVDESAEWRAHELAHAAGEV